MKPDRFDIVTLAVAAALLAFAGFYANTGMGAAANGSAVAHTSQPPGHELILKMASAKAMLEAGQVAESVKSLKEVSAENPGEAEAHALLGQAYSRLLDYPSAVREYRLALSQDADYVDQKSPKFIGKRIKATVKEARPGLKDALRKDPADPAAKASLADVSYLERMLAGGCE